MTAAMLNTSPPPTDNQLLTIKHMCDERGLERPEAVWSVEHGRELFEQIKNGTYRAEDHRVTADPFNPDEGYEDYDLPF